MLKWIFQVFSNLSMLYDVVLNETGIKQSDFCTGKGSRNGMQRAMTGCTFQQRGVNWSCVAHTPKLLLQLDL